MSLETIKATTFSDEDVLSCEEWDEEWEETLEEEEDFFPEAYGMKETEYGVTEELVKKDFIPFEVFKAMTVDELKEYIFYNGIDVHPSMLDGSGIIGSGIIVRYDLIRHAFAHQPVSMEAELTHFQLQRADELNFTAQAIAQVDEKEKLREKWEKRIYAMPVGVPRLVVETILKYVILLNDPKAINKARRISREFKRAIEQEKFVKTIHFQNLQRKYTKVLEEYSMYFGGQIYVPFVKGIGYIPDARSLQLYKDRLDKIDPSIKHTFSSCIKFDVNGGLERFQIRVERNLERCTSEFNWHIKNL